MAKLYAKSPSGEDALLSISITGFTQSLHQNGWCKLPNGLLIQWLHGINNKKYILNLPISYTTKKLCEVATTDCPFNDINEAAVYCEIWCVGEELQNMYIVVSQSTKGRAVWGISIGY